MQLRNGMDSKDQYPSSHITQVLIKLLTILYSSFRLEHCTLSDFKICALFIEHKSWIWEEWLLMLILVLLIHVLICNIIRNSVGSNPVFVGFKFRIFRGFRWVSSSIFVDELRFERVWSSVLVDKPGFELSSKFDLSSSK